MTLIWLLVSCGAIHSANQQPDPATASSGSLVVRQSFSPTLAIRKIDLRVGDTLLVTGSSVCTGSPPNQKCDLLFIPLAPRDEHVVAVKTPSATYDGLPAQQFVALVTGHTVLAPTGPCPTPICSGVAIFPEDLAITVST